MKVAMLVVLSIAALVAVGVTTAIMSTQTPAHAAQDMPMCHINKGSSGCTGPGVQAALQVGGWIENTHYPFGHPVGPH